MSQYTVYNLKQDVDSNLHSGGTSQLANFFNTVDKARRAMLGKVRPEELVRKTYIEEALYPSIERYAVPQDLKYDDIIEIGLLSGYRNVDTMSNPMQLVYKRRFGQRRPGQNNVLNIGYENGIKYLSIMRPMGTPGYPRQGVNFQQDGARHIVINKFDSLTENGTWNVGGNVVNLREDKMKHVQGHGSFSFDINNSGNTGFLECFDIKPIKFDELFFEKGAIFLWVNVGVPQNLQTVTLTLGSDNTNTYSLTVNQPHDNNQFINGFNLLKFVLKDMQINGLPDPSNITYARIDFATTGAAISNMNIDNLVARLGAVYEMTYNSSYMFIDSINGVWKKAPTSNADIIVAEDDTYNLLVMETTLAAQKEIFGTNMGAKTDVGDVTNVLAEMYYTFKREHKSEAILESDDMRVFGNQYDGLTSPPLPGYGGRWGN